MMTWFFLYSLCLIVAFLLGTAFTWVARKIAVRVGLWDRPASEGHKNHLRATPEAGGLAMWCAWVITIGSGLACAALLQPHLPKTVANTLDGISSVAPLLAILAGCATTLMFMGLRDDYRPMKASTKLVWQLVVAAITATFGAKMLTGFLPMWLAWLATTLWIVTTINAFNFFDNMDGLAGGTGAIAFLFLSIIAAVQGQYFVAILNIAALGVILGFLVFNAPPASIFMGDSGSHFLGYLLATSCLLTTFYKPAISPTVTPVFIPLMILAIPLADAVTVVCLRLYLRKPIYVGDNRHISHRFVQLGLSRPLAVLLVCLLSFISGAGALSLIWLPPFGAVLIFAQLLALIAVVLIIQFRAKRSES